MAEISAASYQLATEFQKHLETLGVRYPMVGITTFEPVTFEIYVRTKREQKLVPAAFKGHAVSTAVVGKFKPAKA